MAQGSARSVNLTVQVDIVDDTSPQLGGNLDVNGNAIGDGTNELIAFTEATTPVNEITVANADTGSGPSISATGDDADIDISLLPKGTGDVVLGTLTIDGDQTVGAGQDNYVLTYDDASGTLVLEATGVAGLADVVDDTTPQLGGSLDVNGNKIVSAANGDIDIEPNGTGNILLGNLTIDGDQTVGAGQDNYVLTYDNGTGLVTLETTAAIPLVINTQTGTTYAPVLGDAEAMITMNNASANTVTIPANASVAYPVGTTLNFTQLGAGATTIAITTDTLSVNAALTAVLNGQYASATAVKLTSTTWVLIGNLVPA